MDTISTYRYNRSKVHTTIFHVLGNCEGVFHNWLTYDFRKYEIYNGLNHTLHLPIEIGNANQRNYT